MPISVVCDACLAEFRVREERAGKRVSCRECGEPVRVPTRTDTAKPPASRAQASDIDQLEDWDEQDQAKERRARPRRSPSPLISRAKPNHIDEQNFGPWVEQLASGEWMKALAIPGWVAGIGLAGLFLAGFQSPNLANVFMLVVMLGMILMTLAGYVLLLLMAGREHFGYTFLCICIPVYLPWFIFSRWRKTALAAFLLLGGPLAGFVMLAGAGKAYTVAGVRWERADILHDLLSTKIGEPQPPTSVEPVAPAPLFPAKKLPDTRFSQGAPSIPRPTVPGSR